MTSRRPARTGPCRPASVGRKNAPRLVCADQVGSLPEQTRNRPAEMTWLWSFVHNGKNPEWSRHELAGLLTCDVDGPDVTAVESHRNQVPFGDTRGWPIRCAGSGTDNGSSRPCQSPRLASAAAPRTLSGRSVGDVPSAATSKSALPAAVSRCATGPSPSPCGSSGRGRTPPPSARPLHVDEVSILALGVLREERHGARACRRTSLTLAGRGSSARPAPRRTRP